MKKVANHITPLVERRLQGHENDSLSKPVRITMEYRTSGRADIFLARLHTVGNRFLAYTKTANSAKDCAANHSSAVRIGSPASYGKIAGLLGF